MVDPLALGPWRDSARLGTLMQRSASLPRLHPASAPWERARASLEHLGQQLTNPVTRPAFLWGAFWAPFWIWSDSPKPAWPERGSVVPSQDPEGARSPSPRDLGLAGKAVVTGIDRVRRRLWVTLAPAPIRRAVWLPLAFAAVLMVVDVLGGPPFDPRPAATAGVMLLLAGLVLAALS